MNRPIRFFSFLLSLTIAALLLIAAVLNDFLID